MYVRTYLHVCMYQIASLFAFISSSSFERLVCTLNMWVSALCLYIRIRVYLPKFLHIHTYTKTPVYTHIHQSSWSPWALFLNKFYTFIFASHVEQISDYIRKCCISGLRNARIKNGCKNMDSSVLSISRIWVGLCSSTFGVCCSRELDHQNCELGRLAALDGTKCDNEDNTTSTSYTNCCRACQG